MNADSWLIGKLRSKIKLVVKNGCWVMIWGKRISK